MYEIYFAPQELGENFEMKKFLNERGFNQQDVYEIIDVIDINDNNIIS